MSYRGMMRYAGIGSQSTIAKGIKRFQNLHILIREQRRGDDRLRACGAYRWTLDDPNFLIMAEQTRKREQNEISHERTLRAEERTRRRSAIYTCKDSLHAVEHGAISRYSLDGASNEFGRKSLAENKGETESTDVRGPATDQEPQQGSNQAEKHAGGANLPERHRNGRDKSPRVNAKRYPMGYVRA